MYSVLKGVGYFLAHTPDMVIHNGTTQTTQRKLDPDSEYLTALVNNLRSFEDCLSYPPNQVYIGNKTPDELAAIDFPWYDKKIEGARRFGVYGEIMPEDEFIGIVKISDVFDLVKLTPAFSVLLKAKLGAHPLIDEQKLVAFDRPTEMSEIEELIAAGNAEPIYCDGSVVGCIKSAHDLDETLFAHVIFENLVTKASCVLAILHLLDKNKIDKSEVEYIIECSEEACGDMNQRGGGNFAKSVAEVAGLVNATGSDARGFCAGPAHALVQAASLVKAGVFKNVIVAAGGSTAKLGMNGKDHVKKELPILEDVVAGFAVLISANDGVNPELNTDILGRHTVGTGSSPQNIIGSLTANPLDRVGLKLADIDKYSVEMQNPDITKPAGAGNVPEANYKMIAALAAMRGEIEKADIASFVSRHGMTGWAPTQGHIPSGVPYLGFARQAMLEGTIRRAMIIGKGSLFLGRMTNLFDGVSFVLQTNPGFLPTAEMAETAEAAATVATAEAATGAATAEVAAQAVGQAADRLDAGCPHSHGVIAVTSLGSEHGEATILAAARQAAAKGVRVCVIGGQASDAEPALKTVVVPDEQAGHLELERLFAEGEIQGCVTMHYPFAIGVSTVGRVITPATGREMFLASTTGAAATDRVQALVKNTINGIAVAKACGIDSPTVGLLNIEGARQAKIALDKLCAAGYAIRFADSERSDGGAVMRGNDLITGSCDVMVADSLTGNILMKLFSAYQSGGNYETVGFGYGPGVGEDLERLVLIISRASGIPTVRNAILFGAELVRNNWRQVYRAELAAARRAGLDELLSGLGQRGRAATAAGGAATAVEAATAATADAAAAVEAAAAAAAVAKEVVTEEILGIEVMELDGAVAVLGAAGIYAESGMGCTGPVVLVSLDNRQRSQDLLAAKGFIGT